MKLIHTSDLHLGKIIFSRSMLDEQRRFISDFLCPLIDEEKPDALIIAGDIFDRSIAPPEAIRLFDGLIGFVSERNIPMLAITGNHDGADRITLGAKLLKRSGIHIATDISDAFSPLELSRGGVRARFYMIPHFEPARAREYFNNDEIRGFSESYDILTKKIYESLERECINIALAHCFVSGCSVSDSERPIYIGASAEISASIFGGFDLVLLGHLHSAQRAGDKGFYSGSPIKYSFGEHSCKKGVNIFELKSEGIERRFIEYSPLHDMKIISGKFDELLKSARLSPSEDFLHIHLTDKRPIFMPLQRLREFYPNILEMSTELFAPSSDTISAPSRKSVGEPTELFREFCAQVCGFEADDEEIGIFEDILKEASE